MEVAREKSKINLNLANSIINLLIDFTRGIFYILFLYIYI